MLYSQTWDTTFNHSTSTVRRDGGRLERAVADAVVAALGQDPGDVLVGDIRNRVCWKAIGM